MKGWGILLLAVICAPVCLADPPILILYPQQLQFPASPAISGIPTKQQFILQNGSHADMEWTSKVKTVDGGNWLTLTPAAGTVGPPPDPQPDGPSQMQTYVSVSPAGLKPGVYSGSITIVASRLYQGFAYDAIDSPQTVNVTYTVVETAVPTVQVSTNTVALSGIAGIGAASTSSVLVNNASTGTLNWTAALASTPIAPWLSVSPASGVNTGTIVISAKPASLAPGVYVGLVTVGAPTSSTQPVRVTYTVRAPKPATLDISTTSVNFTTLAGTAPVMQALPIANSGELPLNWKASASTFNGGQWLTVSPAAGVNNGTVTIAPSAGMLAPGVYVGKVAFTSDTGLQAQLQVNFTVTRAVPTLAGNGFYNAASLAPEGVVAGSIVSIFGNHLGPDTAVTGTFDPSTAKLPVVLAGTRVTLDGVAAPLFFVSAQQINMQVPYEVAGKASATAHVEADGFDPADFKILLNPANIGVFTLDGKRAAAINQDGKLNSSDNPAPAGSVVQLYATGQGALDLALPTGAPAPLAAPFPRPVAAIAIQIGGVPAKILFSGMAPGNIGMLQLNVEIPAGTTPSDLTAVQIQTGTQKPNVVYLSTGAAQQ